MYAPTAEDAFDAIRLMVKQDLAGRHLPDDDVRATLTSLTDIVVHCESRDGCYRMTEMWYGPAGNERPGSIATKAMAAQYAGIPGSPEHGHRNRRIIAIRTGCRE